MAWGREDVFRRPGQTEAPAIELEMYQFGGEAEASSYAIGDLARRMPPNGAGHLETAGMIDSQFGRVAMFHRAGSRDGFGACRGFISRIDDPALQDVRLVVPGRRTAGAPHDDRLHA